MKNSVQASDEGSRRFTPPQPPTPAARHRLRPTPITGMPLFELAAEVEASRVLVQTLGDELLAHYKEHPTAENMARAAGVANLVGEVRQRLAVRFFDVLIYTTKGGR